MYCYLPCGQPIFIVNLRKLFIIFNSSMLAVNTDDFAIHVVDVELRRVVRIFTGHHNRVTDMVRPDVYRSIPYIKGILKGISGPFLTPVYIIIILKSCGLVRVPTYGLLI